MPYVFQALIVNHFGDTLSSNSVSDLYSNNEAESKKPLKKCFSVFMEKKEEIFLALGIS